MNLVVRTKTALFYLMTACSIQAVVAQTVEQKQMALVAKKTATWCNPCGTWGWSLFDEVVAANDDKAVVFELHNSLSSNLYSPAASAMYDEFEYHGTVPVFYVNGVNETQYSSTGVIYTSSTKTRIDFVVDSIANISPIANVGYDATKTGNTIQLNTRVKFFQSGTGEFYLGVYLTENDVEEYQNGIGNSAIHHNPLRDAISDNDLGDLIATGLIGAGTEFTNSYTYTVNSSYEVSNVRIFAVIWKKENGGYTYVNAYTKDLFVGEEPKTDNDRVELLLYPSVAMHGQPVKLEVRGNTNGEMIEISVYDELGRMVGAISQGALTTGSVIVALNQNGELQRGLHVMTVTIGNDRYSRKFIIN